MLNRMRYRTSPDRFDEALTPDGELRPTWRTVADSLGAVRPGELQQRQRQSDRLLDAEGAGHMVHELAFERWMKRSDSGTGQSMDSRPWRLDPLPMVLDHREFAELSAAMTQRTRFLELLLSDLYGERRLVRSGVIPASVLFSLPSMRTTVATFRSPRWIVQAALDVVRIASGEWRIVQDLVDAPPGLGFSLLNRAVMARVARDAVRVAGVAAINDFPSLLRQALAAHAPHDRRSPRTVILTGGPGHTAYVEHSYLALLMGFHLAQGADLVVRQGRVWLRALEGLEPIDVICRRLEDDALDPMEPNIVGGNGVPAIVWAANQGGVAMANSFGASVVQEPALVPYFDAAAHALLGEALLIPMLKPTDVLSTVPVYSGSRADSIVPGRAVLRMQAVSGPEGISVMSGGVGRILSPHDLPSRPTSQLVKDVWVVGGRSQQPLQLRYVAPPQVDFGTSVPKRSADALYWMGRAAERAEIAARTVRLISTQINQDPALTVLTDGGWASGALALLRAGQGLPLGDLDPLTASLPYTDRLANELHITQSTVSKKIAELVQEAGSVREFLSTTTGRVLGRLADMRSDLLGSDPAADDLDVILVDLAALSGLTMESMVRGPAWRFLDVGRRVERALALVGSLEAGLGLEVDSLTFQPLAESVLSINESLVAYRRRYRSDVELSAVLDLLVHDDANPRSLAFQLDRLREHIASLAWPEGLDLVQAASLAALETHEHVRSGGRQLAVDGLVHGVRAELLKLSAAVVERWFADPVNPVALQVRT